MADFITVTPGRFCFLIFLIFLFICCVGLPAVEVVLNQVMFEAVIEGQSFLNPPIDGLVGIFLFVSLFFVFRNKKSKINRPSLSSEFKNK